MNFFERQQHARGTSLRLVLLFALAVISIVAIIDLIAWYLTQQSPISVQLQWIIGATLFTLAIIGGGTASKLIALRGGGAAVAQSVGAEPIDPTTRDPRLRRFVNVVEEMSIASGVPMPRLYVMPQEDGINAFAAGYTPSDAAIAVTAGALDRLNRDELQGVIGHEFSHVLNGDMRLNVRLIGLLNGILLLGLVGLRFLQFGGGRSRDSKGNPLVLAAVVLLVLGFVGQFFAGLIKAAVSRQREWLADASAVQFTRQTAGLAGALKKIAGLPAGSTLRDAHSEKQINHMLFGPGKRQSLASTHPPLIERIAALEPGVTPEQLEQQLAALQQQYATEPPDGAAEDAALGLAPVSQPVAPPPTPPPPTPARLTPGDVSARVGTLTPDDLARGARLSSRIPATVRTLAGQGGTAVPLVLGLLLDRRPELRSRQLALISTRLGASTAGDSERSAAVTAELDPLLSLPLAGLAAPALAARPATEQRVLLDVLGELALIDGRVVVFEYALMRVVTTYLADSAGPRSTARRQTAAAVDSAAQALFAVLAEVGQDDSASADRAYRAAGAHFGGSLAPFAAPPEPWRALDAAWPVLDALAPADKQRLIEALVVAVLADGVLRPTEAELLRTACAVLHCPLPPLVA